MRTSKLQIQMTVDGYMAGPNGEMDWMTFTWDEALKTHVAALSEPVDCIVLGRNLAQGFIPHWAAVAANPETRNSPPVRNSPTRPKWCSPTPSPSRRGPTRRWPPARWPMKSGS